MGADCSARLTGRSDVVFGTTVSGRPPQLPGVEEMLGLFINTMPVRVAAAPGPRRWRTCWPTCRNEQSRLTEHQYVGLADIQRLTGVNPLFDTLVVYENYPVRPDTRSTGGLTVRRTGMSDATHYPLCLAVVPGPPMLLRLLYRPGLFDAAAAEAVLDRFERVLGQLAADPGDAGRPADRPGPGRAPYRPGERGTAPTRPLPERSLPELFRDQVERTPGAVAVVGRRRHPHVRGARRGGEPAGPPLIEAGVGPETRVVVAHAALPRPRRRLARRAEGRRAPTRRSTPPGRRPGSALVLEEPRHRSSSPTRTTMGPPRRARPDGRRR